MLTEPQKKWLAALRSGEYKQGKYALKNGEGYCCLGVCAAIAINEGVHAPFSLESYGSLPREIAEWVGLQDERGFPFENSVPSLSGLNDRLGFSFEMIADHIEKHHALYFKDSE